jgi:hypothetical protein
MTTIKRITLLLPAAALACGSHVVDLDRNGPTLMPSTEPGVLGVIDGERVTSLAAKTTVRTRSSPTIHTVSLALTALRCTEARSTGPRAGGLSFRGSCSPAT